MMRDLLQPRITIAAIVCVTLLLITAGVAWSWSSFATFMKDAAGVTFSGVELANPNKGKGAKRCTMRVRLKADVPDKKHRVFSVSIGTSRSKTVTATVPFKAKKKGPTWVTFEHDSSGDGCWTSTIQSPATFDVKGCVGQGCTPQ